MAKLSIPAGGLFHSVFIRGRHMNLPRHAADRHRQILGEVQLPSGARAPGIAADTAPTAEAAADEGAPFTEDSLHLGVALVLQLEDPLTETTLVPGHGKMIPKLLTRNNRNTRANPGTFPALGNGGRARPS